MAFILKADGSMDLQARPKDGKAYTLTELQEIVGGHIEMVRLGHHKLMVLNEEGLLLNLPHNQFAHMYWYIFDPQMAQHNWLVGDVLVASYAELGEEKY